MIKKIIYCLFFYCSLESATLHRYQEELSESVQPKRFRVFEQEQIKISGSAQPSLTNLSFFSQDTYSGRVLLIDLRREFHGFYEGKPISWTLGFDPCSQDSFQYNLGISKELLENQEEKFLTEQQVQSERELILNSNIPIEYIRIPVTNHHHPDEKDIDYFIKLIKNLSSSDWVHFHCAKGKGRTTTFMCMTDMIYHSHLFSVEEILQRQYAIGGVNLADLKDPPSIKRFAFLRLFHQYCLESRKSPENWSSWIQKQAIADLNNLYIGFL